jgi:hypothetical protein
LQPDDALQPVAVALDRDALVAVAGGLQQFLIRWGVGAHGEVHIPFQGNAGRPFTALESILSWPPKTSKSLPGGPRVKDPGRSVRRRGRKREAG